MRGTVVWDMTVKLLLSAVVTFSALILAGCDQSQSQSQSQSQQKNMSNILGSTSTPSNDNEKFSPVIKDVEITFPADHNAHENFRHEWWYLTANLTDENGIALGVQWTQFRFATARKASGSLAKNSAWQSEQIYMAHSAVTTLNKHYADEKWSRGHEELAGVAPSPFRVYLDDWQWRSSTNDLFPATLRVSSQQFAYSLQLSSDAPYQKQGQQGYSTKSADGKVASYYYSQPFINVIGEVVIDGKTHQVSGKGWIDREWSSQFLLDSQQGWDWFALRLSDKTSLVVFQLRDSTTGESSYAHARLMQQDGSGIAIVQKEIALTAIKQTKIQQRNYPTKWQISIPSQQIDVTVSALNPNAKMPLSVPYWEGPVIIQGSHSGNGYMELTGY